MAQIILDIPLGVTNRVLDAIAAAKGWTATSGLTKAQFAKQYIVRHIKDIVQDYEMNAAGDIARTTARAAVETEIDIT